MKILFYRLCLRICLLSFLMLLLQLDQVKAQNTKPNQGTGKDSGSKEPEKVNPDAQYVPGPDSAVQAGVPQGKLIKHHMDDCKTFPGTMRDWWVYVPAQYNPKVPACVMVFQDGAGCVERKWGLRVTNVMDNLIHKKEMPVTIGIFISPGEFKPKPGEKPKLKPDGKPQLRSNRSFEYDTLSKDYSTFLEKEILPVVAKDYNLTKDPEKRCIGGSSSGAICAFNVAWERPDLFRKVISFVGSYTNIRGGDKYPEIVRNADKKPIRIYQQDGKNDVVNQFGSWWEANNKMAAALKEKGYDHIYVTGEGIHSSVHGTMLMPEVMRWIWRDVKN